MLVSLVALTGAAESCWFQALSSVFPVRMSSCLMHCDALKRICGVADVLPCSSDSQVGVLRVWNVSRSTPLDSFKLKKTGFHALHVLNSPLAKKGQLS